MDTFAFGRGGLADVKFGKLFRILVCGRVALCRRPFVPPLEQKEKKKVPPATSWRGKER